MRYICPECGARYNAHGHKDNCPRKRNSSLPEFVVSNSMGRPAFIKQGDILDKIVEYSSFYPLNWEQYFTESGRTYAFIDSDGLTNLLIRQR